MPAGAGSQRDSGVARPAGNHPSRPRRSRRRGFPFPDLFVRVFAFELFSGGGLAGQPLPPSLAHEGDLMLTTLVGELTELPGIEVIASRDPRVPPIPGCEMLVPNPREHPFDLYRRGLAAADAAWPTASEA